MNISLWNDFELEIRNAFIVIQNNMNVSFQILQNMMLRMVQNIQGNNLHLLVHISEPYIVPPTNVAVTNGMEQSENEEVVGEEVADEEP